MKPPAKPPPPAPIRARSKTVRFFIMVCALGLFLVVGLSQVWNLGEIWVSVEDMEVEANGKLAFLVNL